METRIPMPDPESTPREGSRGRRLAVGAAAATIAVCLGVVAWRETRAQERDFHAIRDHVSEMERLIRDHDERIWLHVEAKHIGEQPRPSVGDETAHQAMLNDLDRLGHLKEFAMRDVRIEITGDAAVARYRIEGRPSRYQDPLAPAHGEIRFRRTPAGWEMTSHRLME